MSSTLNFKFRRNLQNFSKNKNLYLPFIKEFFPHFVRFFESVLVLLFFVACSFPTMFHCLKDSLFNVVSAAVSKLLC